jgi:hypothetical protein
MEKKIKHLIEKVIIKKYPVISGVESVSDLFSNLGKEHSSFLGWNYVVNLTTDECLNDLDMIKIDEDIKTLFSMLGLDINNPFSVSKTPQIKTFFDCGNGDGFIFKSPRGYKH